jgi:hypothetical protein
MRPSTHLAWVTNATLALGAAVAAIAIIYGDSARAALAAAPYLGAACVADLAAIAALGKARLALRLEDVGPGAWRGLRAARVFAFAGWQLEILAILNVWATAATWPLPVVFLCYALAAVGVGLGDRLVAMADSPDQRGGSRPVGARGQSRRMFFWLFVVYPMLPLLAASALLAAGDAPYLAFLNPPRAALVAASVAAAAAGLLAAQRYRRSRATAAPARAGVYAALAGLVIAAAGAVAFAFRASLYLYLFSSAAVACGTLGARKLLGAEPPPEPLSSADG